MAGKKKVIKGSHLTVTVHPNGYRELKWDDEALKRDVQKALASLEQPKPKRTRKKKVTS